MIEAVKFGEVVQIEFTDSDPEKLYRIEAKLVRHGAGAFTNETVFARPFNFNIKQIPVQGEIVMLIAAPAPIISGNTTSFDYYYMTAVNIQGSINHNALFKSTKVDSSTPAASPSSDKPKLGEGFVEQNLSSLQLYEGDTVFEGRFGQSIRLGSTVTKKNYTVKPLWEKSDSADNGAPITIIRNTHIAGTYGTFHSEDINADESSIYMTSGQKLPLTEASTKYDSHESAPDAPNVYVKPQVIMTADRILLNARTDSVLIFAKKTVTLSSDDSINIDSNKKTRINSGGNVSIDTNGKKIYLGKDGDESEPVLLGETTTKWLDSLTQTLITFMTNYLLHMHVTGVGPSSPPILPAPDTQTMPSLIQAKAQILPLKSRRNFTV